MPLCSMYTVFLDIFIQIHIIYDNPLRVSFSQASSNHPQDKSPASRNLFSKPEYGSDSNSELVSSIPMAGFKLNSPIGVVQQKLPTG